MANDNFKIEIIGFIICISILVFILGILKDIQKYFVDKMGCWLALVVVIIVAIVIFIANRK